MAFLDILRGRKREEKRPERLPKGALKRLERPVKKQEEIKITSQEKKKKAEKTKKEEIPKEEPKVKTKQSALAAAILLGPHITEQTALLAKEDIYTFKVSHRANKILIKKAIEEMYGFEPIKVRIAKALSKKRIVRGKTGIRPGFKKALVYLKKSDKIDFV